MLYELDLFTYFLSFKTFFFQPMRAAAILEAYVKLLIDDERCGHLVAIYTASLPPEKQLFSYASFLETVTDSTLRRKYVELAEEAGKEIQISSDGLFYYFLLVPWI